MAPNAAFVLVLDPSSPLVSNGVVDLGLLFYFKLARYMGTKTRDLDCAGDLLASDKSFGTCRRSLSVSVWFAVSALLAKARDGVAAAL